MYSSSAPGQSPLSQGEGKVAVLCECLVADFATMENV